MLWLLADNDVREAILSGVLSRDPSINLVRLRQFGLRQADDPDVLEWAAQHLRVVVTHDENTMVGHAYARVIAGKPMPGVLVVPQTMPTGRAIDDLLLAATCHEPEEMRDQVRYLPL